MCGFIGSATFGAVPAPRIPAEIIDRIQWRGPDAYNQKLEPDHCLGSARLAIIDLDPEANQPLSTFDGAWELVFNGEIYNHQELAVNHGLSERARRSDSWALLELIALIGVQQACRRLRGMYAFAAWERAGPSLWLARDPFGIKPLVWSPVNSHVLFGSDPRCLASWRTQLGVACQLNASSLTHYLMLGYVPGDATAWSEIERIEPGQVIAIDASGIKRHNWDPFSDQPADQGVTVDDVDAAFRSSVASHLVADVEVGAFLSGGIDSSLITAIARRQFDAPMRTYSVGFDSDTLDETGAAERMAHTLGTKHVGMRLSAIDFRPLAESVAEAFPEPHADAAAMPTLALSSRASADVKVVLTGEGGDEMFGGYRRYWALPLARRFAAQTAGRLGLGAVMRRVGGRRLRQVAESVNAEPSAAHLRYLTQVHWNELMSVSPACTPALVESVINRYSTAGHTRPTSRSMRILELRRHLPESYLEKTDRATMRYGLEARVPFLDVELASIVLRLDNRKLARPGRTKVLLRELAARHLPRDVATAPKRGLTVPLAAWLSPPSTARWVNESLLGGEATQQGIFAAPALQTMLGAFGNLRRPGNAEALYRLLALELWCRRMHGRSH
jgi:asparagine synthase (glutamine-hydrolysing)